MIDSWDCLALAGLTSLLAGVGFVYWPAALITAGLLALVLYFIRERSRVPQSPPRE